MSLLDMVHEKPSLGRSLPVFGRRLPICSEVTPQTRIGKVFWIVYRTMLLPMQLHRTPQSFQQECYTLTDHDMSAYSWWISNRHYNMRTLHLKQLHSIGNEDGRYHTKLALPLAIDGKPILYTSAHQWLDLNTPWGTEMDVTCHRHG